MNKLNPLYIIVIFVVVFIASTFFLINQKKTYEDKLVELTNVSKSAKEYTAYKSNWNNKAFVERTINKILDGRSFRNQKVLKALTPKVLKVKLESSNQKVLNEFLNKVLNKKLLIKKLQLEKDFISLEIGLRI